MNTKTLPAVGASFLGSALLTPSLFGAGFQLAERSASGLGRAYSGEAAIADDASVLASNPAAMMMLGGNWNYAAGISYINPGADATLYPMLTGGNAGPATRDGDIAVDAWVPYLYLTKSLNDRLTVGIGAYTTYGLKTDYNAATASLVSTDYSEITSININPSLAFRVNDQLSIGAGFNFLYAEGEITAAQTAASPSFILAGNDEAYGFNVGILYELCPEVRFGLSYRSAIELNLEGDATLGPGFPLTGKFPGSLDIELPDIIEFSAYQQINEQWAIHGDITWTQWSKFQTLAPLVTTGFGSAADTGINNALRTPENWDDSFRYSVGTTYKHSDQWTFRAGVAYDEAPVSNQFRTLRIPDGDRVWLSLGASYKFTDAYTLDAGYSYVFIDDVALGQNDALIGTNSLGEGNLHLFSLGVSGRF